MPATVTKNTNIRKGMTSHPVRLHRPTYHRLKALAAKHDMTMQDMLAVLLDAAWANEAGGCPSWLPESILSTNR